MRSISMSILAVATVVTCANAAYAESSRKLLAAVNAETNATKFEGVKSTPTYANVAAITSTTATRPSAPATSEPKHEEPVAPEAPPKPKPPQLSASINLSSQTLTVSVAGATKHVFKISSGRRGYRTPTGSYRPQWMSRMHYSKKYDNAPMPHSVFFHKGYAIHATYATRRLGAPASHGCIRLSPSNAKKFYRLVQKYGKANTRISIHGVARDRVYARKKKKKVYRKKYANSLPNPFATPKVYKKRSRRRGYSTRSKPYATTYAGNTNYGWPGD